MKYIKKSSKVSAVQWFKLGDHEKVQPYTQDNPKLGWLNTAFGGTVVSPGDWVVDGDDGYVYTVKPDIFEKNYELLDKSCFTSKCIIPSADQIR